MVNLAIVITIIFVAAMIYVALELYCLYIEHYENKKKNKK